ncbi:MAG: M15 family metallopeptidase [Legionella sp.]
MFQSSISPIPQKIQEQMQQNTWRAGCPVPMNDLAYVRLSYWGFDEKTHTGTLIVNKELASEVVAIFKVLFDHKYPIQSMELMDVFKGDDNASMTANNTSAFNCRPVTDRPGEYSQHSYGRAIDINPLINPYVNGKKVQPTAGTPYVDRSKPVPGKIIKEDLVYQEFAKYGWDWAGNWYDVQDYQHFEKRANGEKRNPYEYK